MIKNWKKFNESISADEEADMMKNDQIFSQREGEDFDDEGDLEPIGVNNLESQATHGLVLIFSPLESDMVEGWNNDEKVKKFIEEGRLFLNELRYDEWGIYGIEGDREVKNYIMRNYSW
jgi:hypothetical protein